MRNLMIVVLIAVAAWLGWRYYNSQHDWTAPEVATGAASVDLASDKLYTQPVKYSKCTTAEGEVIFGDVPVNVTCVTKEVVNSKITLAPAANAGPDAASLLEGMGSSGQKPAAAAAGSLCDGRTHCSQMRSCEEAKYFLQHCPNVEMDGNHDGIPCEMQWCN